MAERLWQTAEQLLLAKQLLLDGSLPSLRMSLLLIDNTAELLMHRAINQRLEKNRWLEHIAGSKRFKLSVADYSKWCRGSGYLELSKAERTAIEKVFSKKADLLVKLDRLSDTVARVLKALHRYRNEAYHQDRIREETIGSAVRLGFALVVDLLPQLQPEPTVFVDGRADLALRKRFGPTWSKGRLGTVQKKLGKGLGLSLPQLGEDLARHLVDRLVDLEISANMVASAGASWADARDQELQGWCRTEADQALKEWRTQVLGLRKRRSKLGLFLAFVSIEEDIERREGVHELANQVHTSYELAYDVWRGK